MLSLLPAANEVGELPPEEVDPDDVNDPGQCEEGYEEERYAV